MEIKKAVLDELIKDYKKPEDLIGETGLLKQLTKALLERALSAELAQHLGYEKHDPAGYNSGNSRNGTHPEDGKRRVRRDGGGDAAGPQRRVRAADPEETSDALGRVRRQDPVDVFARDDDARDPRALAGDVRGGGEPDADLGSDRRGDGGGEGVAEPGAGAVLRDRVSGCAVREDAARRAGGEPRGVRGDGSGHGRAKGCAGAVDQRQRGSQVLAGSADGTEEPRGEGHPDRVRGRAEGFPQAIESVYPEARVQTVHRASGAGEPELRELEGAQAGGGGSEGDLPGGDGAASGAGTERLHRQMGTQIPGDRQAVEGATGSG